MFVLQIIYTKNKIKQNEIDQNSRSNRSSP